MSKAQEPVESDEPLYIQYRQVPVVPGSNGNAARIGRLNERSDVTARSRLCSNHLLETRALLVQAAQVACCLL